MRSLATGFLLLTAASAQPLLPSKSFQQFRRFANDSNSGNCDSSKYICDSQKLCGLPFDSTDQSVISDTWGQSGANDFLHEFLSKDGIDDWADRLFQSTIGDGTQGGSTYQCSSFPSPGLCAAPGHNLCVNYNPPPMFFVHISISNFYNAFNRIHEALQDKMIIELASGIKEVVDKFGPPEPKNLFPFLIGSFVGGAALAGPVWQVAAPMTAVVSLLNLISGATPTDGTPSDFEHDLEKSLGDFYSSFTKTLEETVRTFYDGTFWKLNGFSGNGVDFIMDKFAKGKMLNMKLVDQDVDVYIESTKKMISQGMIFQALKGQKYFIWKNPAIPQNECEGISDAVWINDRCTRFAKPATSSREKPTPLSDEQTEILTGTYGIDIRNAIDNGLRCAENGGGSPDMSVPSFDGQGQLPACFISLDVREDEFEIPCDNPRIC